MHADPVTFSALRCLYREPLWVSAPLVNDQARIRVLVTGLLRAFDLSPHFPLPGPLTRLSCTDTIQCVQHWLLLRYPPLSHRQPTPAEWPHILEAFGQALAHLAQPV